MRISTRAEYLQIEPSDDVDVEESHTLFPHHVVVECDLPEWNVAIRWCWNNFGPRDGECWSQLEYATCPIILKTEHTEKMVVRGKEYEIKRYLNVDAHHHVGSWTTNWFGKTDYDHGFGEFCFSSEQDRAKFLEYVPQVDWGENFPWLIS